MHTMQNALVIGQCGRAHALGLKLRQSLLVNSVFFAPGNAGTASIGKNCEIREIDSHALKSFCRYNGIGLAVISSEASLIRGLADELQKVPGLAVFGPSQQAAKLEASKVFAKIFMDDFEIPTAPFEVFDDYFRALAHVRSRRFPIMLKASGPAGGKGAVLCRSLQQAEKVLWEMMHSDSYGTAGLEVVIEDVLVGKDASMHVLSDGRTFKVSPFVQDYKQLGPNPFGLAETLNTGSMGSVGPIILSPADYSACMDIAHKIFAGLQTRGIVYKGCMKVDLMLTEDGPKVLEINVRFGDSEAQVLMRLLKSDLYEALFACATGKLADIELEWYSGLFAACINPVSGGYPGKYKTGCPITGFEKARQIKGVEIYHAGTALRGDEVVTNGGRVVNSTATGETLQEAVGRAYLAASCIHFEGMHYHPLIGHGLLVLA
jgi:phosphoribosylamine--glycine ligase